MIRHGARMKSQSLRMNTIRSHRGLAIYKLSMHRRSTATRVSTNGYTNGHALLVSWGSLSDDSEILTLSVN